MNPAEEFNPDFKNAPMNFAATRHARGVYAASTSDHPRHTFTPNPAHTKRRKRHAPDGSRFTTRISISDIRFEGRAAFHAALPVIAPTESRPANPALSVFHPCFIRGQRIGPPDPERSRWRTAAVSAAHGAGQTRGQFAPRLLARHSVDVFEPRKRRGPPRGDDLSRRDGGAPPLTAAARLRAACHPCREHAPRGCRGLFPR